MKRSKRRERLGHDAGQALTEAAIGMCLMGLTWMMATYSCYISANGIRTAVGARYVAWYNANTPESTRLGDGTLQTHTFAEFNRDLATQEASTGGEGPSAGGFLLPDDNDLVGWLSGIAGAEQERASVRFGLGDDSPGSRWPFMLAEADMPLQPTPLARAYFNVSGYCEWERCHPDDTFEDFGDAVTSIITSLFDF